MGVHLVAVTPAYIHKNNIQWELDASSLAAGSHSFEVLRSGSPHGDWEPVTPEPLIDVMTYQDDKANLFAMDRDIYYKIQAVALATNTVYHSNVRNMMGDFDRRRYLLWRKMNYDEEIMLKKGNGIPLCILKRKSMGVRCPDCYDPLTGKLVLSKCTTCNKTGWIGGFYPAIKTWGHIKPSSVGVSESNQTSIPHVQVSSGFLLNFPRVTKDDVIVEERTNMRWLVDSEQPTELIRATVHQDLVLRRLPIDAIEYSIAVA